MRYLFVLGADLALPFDQGEQGYWRRDLAEVEAPQTPSVGTPLTDLVSGAPGLTRALQGVSVIDEAEGDAAQALLKPLDKRWSVNLACFGDGTG